MQRNHAQEDVEVQKIQIDHSQYIGIESSVAAI